MRHGMVRFRAGRIRAPDAREHQQEQHDQQETAPRHGDQYHQFLGHRQLRIARFGGRVEGVGGAMQALATMILRVACAQGPSKWHQRVDKPVHGSNGTRCNAASLFPNTTSDPTFSWARMKCMHFSIATDTSRCSSATTSCTEQPSFVAEGVNAAHTAAYRMQRRLLPSPTTRCFMPPPAVMGKRCNFHAA